jgi:hypothetical protein
MWMGMLWTLFAVHSFQISFVRNLADFTTYQNNENLPTNLRNRLHLQVQIIVKQTASY